ncbi:MAG: T9SS-dependent M36 family metallopeptidase [Raineya sp.]
MMKKLQIALLCMLFWGQGMSQNNLDKVLTYLRQEKGLTFRAKDWKVTDEIHYQQTGVSYLYLRQVYQDVEIINSSVSVMLKDGKVRSFAGNIYQNLQPAATSRFRMSAPEAIRKATQNLGVRSPLQVRLSPNSQRKGGFDVYDKGDFSYEPVPIKKVYFLDEKNKLHAAWSLSLAPIGTDDWWDITLDANEGKTLHQTNWTTKCSFDHQKVQAPQRHQHDVQCLGLQHATAPNSQLRSDGASYRVFDLPVESPIHGSRTLVSNPADVLASPFGWHDTNGAAGAEFTYTRGNNVHAYEDRNNNNAPGFSPDGGVSLTFDFPYNNTMQPNDYLDFAITNTFYISNIIHDIFYYMGFDEPSGNFQVNNYGRGGLGNDDVRAEAQDGSGRNNANFSTPPDGSRPRMQMFIWDARSESKLLNIASPASVAGEYTTGTAQFGPPVTATPITGQLQMVNDGSASPSLGCVASPAGSLSGKIALVDRGDCAFTIKVKNAQDAGAIGVVVVNNVGGGPINMGGTDPSITIPSVMISLADGDAIKNAMQSGTVIGSLVAPPTSTPVDTDSDLDNGIIIHEYGHGISTRLTGGPSNASCLGNAEQMGEGWSDYFGIVLTMKATDTPTQLRGVGTYVMGQTTSGNGIRPAPYTTDRNVNNFTYADLPNPSLTQPHGIGFVWCTILWDMTWKFVERYGFDANLKTGSGGNRKALKLVVEGLKLQPCNPGFEDGRDAILKANKELFGGADLDIIWEAFADRGLGYYASQGSSNNRNDGIADFTRPPLCPADAGNLVRPSATGSGDIKINEGNDIGAFKVSYNASNQKDPADPNNTYTFGENFTYAFLLSRNDTLIAYNRNGDFDYSTLPAGLYNVWGMSFKTLPNSLETYIAEKTKISQIQADITNGLICAKLTQNYTSGTIVTVEILGQNNGNENPTSFIGNLESSISIYPNPSNGEFHIKITENVGANLKVSIYTAQGKQIFSKKLSINTPNFQEKISTAQWAKGVYLIKFEGEKQLFAEKLIVE